MSFLTPIIPSPLAGLTELPNRLRIGKWGKNEGVNGSFTVGPKTVKFLPLLQKALGFDTVALDYEHNTLKGTSAFDADKEPRNVAAHGALEVVDGDGLYFVSPKWTPSGETSVKAGLHPDLSPAVRTDESGEVIFCHSAALCRQGSIADLKLFSAEWDGAAIFDATTIAAFSAIAGTATTEPTKPAPAQPTSTMDHKSLLLTILGLTETATDAEITAAAQALAKSSADDSAGDAQVEAFSASLKTATDHLNAITKRLDAQERAALVSTAMGDGKIIPHGASIDALDNAAFGALLDTLPAGQVPTAQRTPEGIKAFSAASVPTAQSAAELAVAKQMHNDPEKLKQYGDKVR